MAAAQVSEFPRMSHDEGLPAELQEKLKAPMPPEAVSQHPTKKYLSSIKPAFVIERMNDVFGIGGYREVYRDISVTSKEVEYKEKNDAGDYTGKARKALVFSGTVHGTLTVPKYDIHLENFGGSENEDAGDALKGACTDAFTKMCSHLGVGLDVYKGRAGGGSSVDSLPACPKCKKSGSIIKGKAEYGGGFVCFTKKEGCGAKFTDVEMEQIKTGKVEPPAKPAQSAQQAPKPAAKQQPVKDVEKLTIQQVASEIKQEGDILWVTVGERKCVTRQPDLQRQLFGVKGKTVELLVSELNSERHGTIYQIHKVIAVGGRA